jgi:hypothetical protein
MLVITDNVESHETYPCRAYLHFHPDVVVCIDDGVVSADGVLIDFSGASEVKIGGFMYAAKFNVLIPSKVVTVTFSHKLTTSIPFTIANEAA